MPQSSGYKSKQEVETVQLISTFGLRFSLEDVAIALVRNFCKFHLEYTDFHARLQLSLAIFFFLSNGNFYCSLSLS